MGSIGDKNLMECVLNVWKGYGVVVKVYVEVLVMLVFIVILVIFVRVRWGDGYKLFNI